MAEKLAEATGSLAEGAERLDRLIRGVKDRQFSDALNAPSPKAVSNAFAVSPEEAWSKKFMTAGIGPNDFKPVQMPAVSIAAPPPMPAALKPEPKSLEPGLQVRMATRDAVSPVAQKPARAAKPAPIGHVLAKPVQKRSWFGRLVRGN